MNSYSVEFIDLSQLEVCDLVLMAQLSQALFNLALSESLTGTQLCRGTGRKVSRDLNKSALNDETDFSFLTWEKSIFLRLEMGEGALIH